MDEQINTEEIVGLTPEQILTANKIRFVCKKMADVIASLPDDVLVKYGVTTAKMDEIFKPIVQELYKELAENNISIEDIEDSVDLVASTQTFTLKRIVNYFDPTIKYVYADIMGFEDPYKQMGIGEWEKRRNDIATRLSTAKSE